MASAFAAGCVAAFAFLSMIGGFIWKIIGKTRQDRIDEIAKDLADERRRCSEMESRLVSRIEQLETILMFEVAGNVRQGATLAIAELRRDVTRRADERDAEDDRRD